MTATLYTFALSLWASAPRLLINELDITNLKEVQVDLSKAENFTAEYLAVNPHNTVPALTAEKDGKVTNYTSTIEVVSYLNEVNGSPLSIPDKQNDIDAFLELMHGEADVGNQLFFTSGSVPEVEAKKGLIVPFVGARVTAWESFIEKYPAHADLYRKNIASNNGILAAYNGNEEAQEKLFAANKQFWATGLKFLDHAEALIKDNEYVFGAYSVADIHFTPYLFRFVLVSSPETIFATRPALGEYYKRVQARPSFAKTFQS
jgi:glutathione S-transferase